MTLTLSRARKNSGKILTRLITNKDVLGSTLAQQPTLLEETAHGSKLHTTAFQTFAEYRSTQLLCKSNTFQPGLLCLVFTTSAFKKVFSRNSTHTKKMARFDHLYCSELPLSCGQWESPWETMHPICTPATIQRPDTHSLTLYHVPDMIPQQSHEVASSTDVSGGKAHRHRRFKTRSLYIRGLTVNSFCDRVID